MINMLYYYSNILGILGVIRFCMVMKRYIKYRKPKYYVRIILVRLRGYFCIGKFAIRDRGEGYNISRFVQNQIGISNINMIV
ncbi:MAG: hypothetical protein P857_726 [Candidatus Xenolissoclinum pacificiensis L6]|uniref:Uncharacterized protein n=1 Tax=Candidatus Xenolissoclinum pacificiensis L6 TaxID=1401685 RepID=W2V1D5_9RICK|nr:MAG: hypothetical protein P857_726 [Candidatus Xenolissoclinum pacificiensis L6]